MIELTLTFPTNNYSKLTVHFFNLEKLKNDRNINISQSTYSGKIPSAKAT